MAFHGQRQDISGLALGESSSSFVRLKYVHERVSFLENSWNFRKSNKNLLHFTPNCSYSSCTVSKIFFSPYSSSSSSSSYTTMSGIDCANIQPVRVLLNIARQFRGTPRAGVARARMRAVFRQDTGVRSLWKRFFFDEQFTAEQFFNAYTYWERVKDEGFGDE